jgi:Pyruvate ferredoxin oxidoreductase beta subunit C terminal/Thiamine pyrophosphate enzyme, C-terminal TPP binding domain
MAIATAPARDVNEFKPEVPPGWCPGCGDFGVLITACADLGLRPHDVLVVSGIGCSSNLPGFFRAYGVHSLHGRALPFATGAKLANPAITVIVTGGDGDGHGIGLNHFIQAMRRNITYDWFRKRVYKLEDAHHEPADFHAAMDAALEWGEKIPIGLVYWSPNPRPSLDAADPGLQGGVLLHQMLHVSAATRRTLIEEFM